MADGSSECACYISVNHIIISESFKVNKMKFAYAKRFIVGKDVRWNMASSFCFWSRPSYFAEGFNSYDVLQKCLLL